MDRASKKRPNGLPITRAAPIDRDSGRVISIFQNRPEKAGRLSGNVGRPSSVSLRLSASQSWLLVRLRQFARQPKEALDVRGQQPRVLGRGELKDLATRCSASLGVDVQLKNEIEPACGAHAIVLTLEVWVALDMFNLCDPE